MKNHIISRILVAIDGSEESMAAAKHAIAIASIQVAPKADTVLSSKAPKMAIEANNFVLLIVGTLISYVY
jgi:nucleotide-binding universal stress UspA family protein